MLSSGPRRSLPPTAHRNLARYVERDTAVSPASDEARGDCATGDGEDDEQNDEHRHRAILAAPTVLA